MQDYICRTRTYLRRVILYSTGTIAAKVPFIDLLVFGIDIYLLMILSHLIGRFYYRNSRKLNWEV
jgi:hypothetical protein